MIDLHVHSTASDGSHTPKQILALAVRAGIKALSITDHDTVDGIKELLSDQTVKPVEHPCELITGVEISCDPPIDGLSGSSIHILGYGFSVYDVKLNELLDRLQQARERRNPEIIAHLNRLGCDITEADVAGICRQGQAGRPHIAQAMVEKGFVASFDQAFDRYLAKGRPAYVDKFRVSCSQAIDIIKNAGGLAVLAHPGLIESRESGRLETLMLHLIEDGLEGIEVYYTDHSPEQVGCFEKFARQHGLLITGGSDFHGSFNKGVALGTGAGNLNVGYAVFRKLKARLNKVRPERNSCRILADNIGHVFSDPALLGQALCHRSFMNETPLQDQKDNERLEFLGDAVLGLCVGQMLMENYPGKKEGELSKMRAVLVSEPGLSEIARKIDLGRFIKLGKGERLSLGHEKNSILSDTFEALIAAVYKDAGFEVVFRLVRKLFQEKMTQGIHRSGQRDFKSRLQEYVQEKGRPAPVYCLDDESGPDHDKTFDVVVNVMGVTARGRGKTKKAAEQACAEQALALIDRQ